MLSVQHLFAPGVAADALEVADGECVAVMGPSGAGKTRLLRAIADLDPNRGEVAAGGVDRARVSGPAWRRVVGYVAAESGWWADTVGPHFPEPEEARALLEAILRRQLDAGTPILMVTHDQSQAERLAARIVHVANGHLVRNAR